MYKTTNKLCQHIWFHISFSGVKSTVTSLQNEMKIYYVLNNSGFCDLNFVSACLDEDSGAKESSKYK